MDDFLIASMFAFVVLLVFCNPIAVLTVGWLYKRTGKLLMPSVVGVLVNVASLTLVVLGLGWWSGEFSSSWLDTTGLDLAILVLLVSLLATLLHGLLLVGVVLLVIRERRLEQTMPSKLAMTFFVGCLSAGTLLVSQPTDGLGSEQAGMADKLVVAYISAYQDASVEFQGHTVHLGDDYIYLRSSERLVIQKLGPGFGQYDEDFYLWYEPGVEDIDQVLGYWCGLENYSCEQSERDNYFVVSQTHFYSDESDEYTATIYYSPECDVQLGHFEKDPDGRYTRLVETFFSESCA